MPNAEMTNDANTEAAAALLLMNASGFDPSSKAKDTRPSPPSVGSAGSKIKISTATGGIGISPQVNDVLTGRGNGVNNHPGNVQFRSFVASVKNKYLTGAVPVKREVTKHVISLIKSQNPPGRFLKQNPLTEVWEEVDYDHAFKKTCQALRERPPVLRKVGKKDLMAKDAVPNKRSITETVVSANGKIATSCINILGKKDAQQCQKTKKYIKSANLFLLSSLHDKKSQLKDLEYRLNYKTFSIYQSLKKTSEPRRRIQESHEKLGNLAIVASSSPHHLTNLFIITKMCSDAFETLSGPTKIHVSHDDVLIGAQFDLNHAHAGNAKLASQFRAYHGNDKTLTSNSTKTMNHRNTRFFELDDKSGKWKILSMKEAKSVMDSLYEQTFHCCFEPNSADVLMPPEKTLVGIPAAKTPNKKNEYFESMLNESKVLLDGSNQLKEQLARDIVQNILARNGKFLQYDLQSAAWVIATPKAGLEFTLQELHSMSKEDDSNVGGNLSIEILNT